MTNPGRDGGERFEKRRGMLQRSARKQRSIAWRVLRSSLAILICLYLVVMLFEDNFIYFPSKYPEGDWELSAQQPRKDAAHPRIEDCVLTTSDSVRLHGWYCTPDAPRGNSVVPGRITVLWFHGNAGNITHRYNMAVKLMRFDVELFMLDYRGYGRSDGKPSEAGLYRDGLAAWQYLVSQRGIDPRRIVFFGRSLGGAVAIELASRDGIRPAGMIIESTFTSVPDMASQMMVPRFLIRTQMDSVNKIGSITIPKLFVHSLADEIIPFEHGRRLFDAAGEPKQFYQLVGATHNETEIHGGRPYLEALYQFMERCTLSDDPVPSGD